MANLFIVPISSTLIESVLVEGNEFTGKKIVKGIPDDSRLVNVIFKPLGDSSSVGLMFETDEPLISSGNGMSEIKVVIEDL